MSDLTACIPTHMFVHSSRTQRDKKIRFHKQDHNSSGQRSYYYFIILGFNSDSHTITLSSSLHICRVDNQRKEY